MADTKLTALSELSVPALEDLLYIVDDPSGTPASAKISTTRIGGVLSPLYTTGRLTLATKNAIPESDLTAQATLYYTSVTNDDGVLANTFQIVVFDGTRLRLYSSAEISLSLTGLLTASTPHDVFIYDNSGTLTLEVLAWTNGTTRATALAAQSGQLVKTGATSRRYLGTLYATGTGTTADAAATRYLYNAYNQAVRELMLQESTSTWTLARSGSPVWNEFNNSTGNRVGVMMGLVGPSYLTLGVYAGSLNSGAGNFDAVGIVEDGTGGAAASNECDMMYRCGDIVTGQVPLAGYLQKVVPLGFHFYQALEWAYGVSGNATFIGTDTSNNSRLAGLLGSVVL